MAYKFIGFWASIARSMTGVLSGMPVEDFCHDNPALSVLNIPLSVAVYRIVGSSGSICMSFV